MKPKTYARLQELEQWSAARLSAQRQAEPRPDAQVVIQSGLSDNPEVRLVLEIAMRARELASTEQPISMDAPGSFTATASISQAPFR